MSDYEFSSKPVDADETALQAVLQARQPLKEEIEAVIAPHRQSSEKPSLTAAELVVMAIACNDEEFMTKNDFLMWAICTFYYYKTLAAEEYARKFNTTEDDETYDAELLEMIVHGFDSVWGDCDVPIETRHYTSGSFNSEPTRHSIKPHQARLCLRQLLEPERVGKFEFLNLVPELRNRVYGYLLNFSDYTFMVFLHREHNCIKLRHPEDHHRALSE